MQNRAVLIFKLLIVLLLFFLFYSCSVNPVSGKKEFSLMSESMEKSIGKENYPVYTQINYGAIQDTELQNYVQKVGKKLAVNTHRPNLEYEFNVVNSSVPNAYALPGGKVSITRGLITRLQNEDQLAGIFGHELGHINARHTATQYTKTILANAALAGITYYLEKQNVGNKDLYTTAGMYGTQLLLLKYSRDDERQADNLGIEYMVKSGYNPQAFVEVMQIIQSLSAQEPSKWETLMSTHPLNSERVKTAQANATSKYFQYTNIKYKDTEFNLALSNLKSNLEAYNNFDKGLALEQEKKFSEAKKYFETAINLYDKESLFYTFLADAEFNLKNNNSAYQFASKAVSLNSDLFFSRLIKGITEISMKNYNESIIDLTKADSLIKDNPVIIFNLAVSYDCVGNAQKAVENYQKILQLTNDEQYLKIAKDRIAQLTKK